LVRDYATSAIMGRYARTDPDGACGMILERARAAMDAGIINDTKSVVYALADLAGEQKQLPLSVDVGGWDLNPVATREAAVDFLFAMLDDPEHPTWKNLNSYVLDYLDDLLPALPRDAAQMYDAEARQCYSGILRRIDAGDRLAEGDHYVSRVGRVQAWLNKPAASATQPAAGGR
jgi:hypothetical protein